MIYIPILFVFGVIVAAIYFAFFSQSGKRFANRAEQRIKDVNSPTSTDSLIKESEFLSKKKVDNTKNIEDKRDSLSKELSKLEENK